MAQALYLKYRPKVWSDIQEQTHIKQILNAELTSGNIKRCLLFTGPAGCGKTTSARIYANELEKCSSNIYELNCANYTGVDDIRKFVIEPSKTKPLVGNYKIFILDENHQLTVQAQNALLKILEEPPEYCIFILCTTDPQKVLSTILSRCMRYDFQLISHVGVVDRLSYILNTEKAEGNPIVGTWDNEALDYIATASNGHMRDAINLLEKVMSYDTNLTVDTVSKVLNITDYSKLFGLLSFIIGKDQGALLASLDDVYKSGMDLKLFIKQFLSFVLDVNKYVILVTEKSSNPMGYLSIPTTYQAVLKEYNISHRDALKHLLTTLLELNTSIKWETSVKPVIESTFLLEIL